SVGKAGYGVPAPIAPGSTAPGSAAPGSTAPGSTAPGSTAPWSAAPGSTGGRQTGSLGLVLQIGGSTQSTAPVQTLTGAGCASHGIFSPVTGSYTAVAPPPPIWMKPPPHPVVDPAMTGIE